MKRSIYIYIFICLIGVLGIYQLSRPATSSKSNDSLDSSKNDPIPSWRDDDLVNSRKNSSRSNDSIDSSKNDPIPSWRDEDLVNVRKNRKPVGSTEKPRSNPDKLHLEICRRTQNIRGAYLQSPSSNYRGTSIISNSTDVVLCPGDYFGDLNKTYVTVQDCNLAMYHQENLIWSSNQIPKSDNENMLCAISLQKDGNLVVYKESMTCFFPVGSRATIWPAWESKTNFKPVRTELRIQDQQLQMIHILRGGSQRIFYAGENIREFREDQGTPTQIAKDFLIINHNDDVILRENEYMGDLNGTHLILQSNCELQLNHNNKTIWSFAAYLKPDGYCTLSVQGNSIGIPKVPGGDYQYEGMNILPLNDFTVLQSNITFFGDQLYVIQTLKNGSEITFYSEPGQDNGMKLKRELRQIAPNNLTISSELTLERLDYIGNLDGLHLILQDNCVLTLADGQEELWKLTIKEDRPWRLRENLDGPFMECNVQFNEDGTIMSNRLKNNKNNDASIQVFGKKSYQRGDRPTKFQLFLENNLMIMTLQYQNKTPHIYQAGSNTNGTWFRFISAHSVFVNANDTQNLIIQDMSYIGDINGVYVILDKRANLILYNKTQVLWESRTTQGYELGFALILTRDGDLAITYNWATDRPDQNMWCTQTSEAYKQAKLKTSELLVNNDGLWLINTYVDGALMKFKALEGTETFNFVSKETKPRRSPPTQIYK